VVSDDRDTVLKWDHMKWTSTRGREVGKSGHRKVDIGGQYPYGEAGENARIRILWTCFVDGPLYRSTSLTYGSTMQSRI